MSTKKTSRLVINRETVRQLDNDELKFANGGRAIQLSVLLPTCYCVPITYACNVQ